MAGAQRARAQREERHCRVAGRPTHHGGFWEIGGVWKARKPNDLIYTKINTLAATLSLD